MQTLPILSEYFSKNFNPSSYQLPKKVHVKYRERDIDVHDYKTTSVFKALLSNDWKLKQYDYEIAQAIVVQWGGVKSNKPERLKHYVDAIRSHNLHFSSRGVATYSKILMVSDPLRYAILDARVVAAINIILLNKDANARLLPNLPTQNKKIKLFNQENEGRMQVDSERMYNTYLHLLYCLKEMNPSFTLQDMEMQLFVDAPKLVEKRMQS